MNQIRRNDQCIERRSLINTSRFFSVSEYQEGFRRAKYLSNPRAKAFHGVGWTEDAPKVEKLTIDWQQSTDCGRFRICDWDAYDSQMRQLLGIL